MSVNQFLQAINETIRGEISGIHTAMPGRIISYGGGRATVQPEQKYKVADGRRLDMPIIVNVPCYFLGCEGRSITIPIKAGDGCLLLFAERSIDDWLLGGESDDPRKYDLTDAFALVGLQPSRSHSNDAITITHGSCVFSIPEGGPINCSTDIIIKGISFLGHVHRENDGGGPTDPPK